MHLQSKNWKIEKLNERDIPELIRIFSEEASIPEQLERSSREMKNLTRYFETILENAACGSQIYFLARTRTEGALIGGVSFVQDDDDASVWERSFWVRNAFRGEGCATQMTSLTTDWMFSNGLATEVQEMTRPDNRPSIRIKERQGFLLDSIISSGAGILRRDILQRSHFVPQHI